MKKHVIFLVTPHRSTPACFLGEVVKETGEIVVTTQVSEALKFDPSDESINAVHEHCTKFFKSNSEKDYLVMVLLVTIE